jgi:hypothetical protein
MGIEKFRSGEEMQATSAKTPGGDGFERFLRHCARCRRIAPLVFPRGVFKFRSVLEAQEARDRVAESNARRLRSARGHKKRGRDEDFVKR